MQGMPGGHTMPPGYPPPAGMGGNGYENQYYGKYKG